MSTIIADNKLAQGRSIFIRSNPTVGVVALTMFTDDNNGPQGLYDFQKTFRYTVNGVIWSKWLPLNLQNIISIPTSEVKPFTIEISYYSLEAPGTALLDVDSATLTYTEGTLLPTPVFDTTLFKRYFEANDQEVLNWYVNVLEKLWDKGLIASYIVRDKDNPNDFMDFWGGVTKMFAYYVKFARTFATFYNNVDLLRDFLEQRGLNTSPEDSLPQLQEMQTDYYFQIAKRGTDKIFREQGVNGETLNGEARRIIHYKGIDEFLVNVYRPENFGWCLGSSSPLYRGLRVNDGINKIPWSIGYTSMTEAGPWLSGSAVIVEDGGIDIAALSDGGQIRINNLKVDPNLDYEFSFQLKLEDDATLSFGITGKNVSGGSVGLKSRVNNSTVTSFFTDAVVSRDDKYVTVRCYLYNKNRGVFADDTTNIRQGQNIIAPAALQTISIVIEASDGLAAIKDFKIMPMMTSYSRGFIQVNNFITAWIKNRNSMFNLGELEDYFEHYLAPYNSHIKFTNVGDLLYTDVEEDIDTTFWVGAGEYCRMTTWIGEDPACELQNLIWVPDESSAYCEQE